MEAHNRPDRTNSHRRKPHVIPVPDGPPVAPLSRPQRIAANVMFSGGGRAWSAVLLFITIPVVVHGIGTSAYGIYAIVAVVLGYVAFLDFGLTAAVVRSVSRHRIAGDSVALERAVGTALTLLIGLGLLGAIAIVLLSPLIISSILHVPSGLREDATFALRVAGLGFGCNMVLVVFAGVVQGLQRLDIFASRSVIISTLTSLAQIGAVTLGGGLRWLVIATIVVSIFGFAIFLVASRRLLPGTSFRPRLDRAAVRELWGFGLFRFVNQLSGQVTTQIDPIVIGIFQPIAAVGLYSVPLAVTQKFHLAEDSVASAYFPAAVELHAQHDTERLHRLYVATFKVVLVGMAFLIVVCVGYAGEILTAWVGQSIAQQASLIFALLACGYGLSALIGIPAQTADATGNQRWTAGFAVASAVIQLTLALILVPRFGAIGAAEALLINTVTQGAVFVWLVQHRFLQISALTVFRGAVARPLVAALGLAIFVLVTRQYLQSIWSLIAALAAAGVLYLGLTLALRVWNQEELRLATQLARGLWTALSSIRLGGQGRGRPAA
jgi:O-antigen/teichoic acid export membrane protein